LFDSVSSPFIPALKANHRPIMPFRALFLIFLIVPFIEIWLLIKVGGLVGAGWTIMLVVATAVIGAALVRAQGLSTLSRIQQEMAVGRVPATEMVQGMFLVLAGALLITPGFFTDAIGFSLLIPAVRGWLAQHLFLRAGAGFVFQAGANPARPANSQDALDAEFKREE